MVKLQIGASTFVCETAEEAVRIHHLLGVNGGAPLQGSAMDEPPGLGRRLEDGATQIILKKLAPYAGQEVNSEEMVKILEAKNLSGLGPKMRQLRASFESANMVFDHYIVKRKPDASTPTTWLIAKAAA